MVKIIYADLIIGADGANSRVRKYINFMDNDKKRGYIKIIWEFNIE